jgi:CheY-like chemotaxis protein
MRTGLRSNVVIFPARPKARARAVTSFDSDAVPDSAPRAKVLVAHCDERTRESLAKLLDGNGYEIETCADGYEAKTKLSAAKFDLLITAVAMPDMDGLELMRVLREQMPSLPVIALSAGLREIDGVYLRNAELLGAAATHAAPIVPRVLLRCVEQALHAKTDTPS